MGVAVLACRPFVLSVRLVLESDHEGNEEREEMNC